jgi:hypothetical protein
LSIEIGTASRSFTDSGIAILRRPALEQICNENGIPRQSDRSQHFIKQLAGAADEWFTAPVFFGAGRLANDHPVCRFAAYTEYSLCTGSV